MQDLHSGTIKLRYAVKLLMKGLLFRALFCPPEQGEVRRSRIGGGERSDPISRMVILPYGAESKSRNADFILIARKGDTTTLGPKGRQT